jgi:K+-transporting ATPase ATPase A chain
MTSNNWLQLGIYLALLLALAKPLGEFMARVFQGQRTFLSPILGPVERLIYRLIGVRADQETSWKRYAYGFIVFHALGFLALFGLQRLQHVLPLNPEGLGAVTPDSSFNTAVSFVTNTNWQGYGGESTMSYLTQMLGLAVQNFVSAAAGIAVLVALIRGFVRKSAETIGSFWVDLVRVTLYVLLPLSIVVALVLVWQGTPQTFHAYAHANLIDAGVDAQGQPIGEQVIALGPVASQIAIKQLGTNGGGFYNSNSAHPLENPTPLSNLVEMLSILLISAGLCFTFGRMVGDKRQGWAILATMLLLFLPLTIGAMSAEQAGNPRLESLGIDAAAADDQPGGNMEGKELRYGIASSALWASATTAASNGSVNSMHDSYTPLGGLVPMFLMQLGEVVFGGVGSGLYGMLVFAIVAVFIAGLMVGRTPEYLGKKIESFEMKMASIAILVPCLAVLVGTAIAVLHPLGKATIYNPGVHGFSEVLYAFSSAANNNGSAFAGLGANNPFYNLTLGVAMLMGRFLIAVPVLAVAGSLAAKKLLPRSAGTLPTHGPIFVTLLAGTVLLVGALTFVPALALGPIVEQLMVSAQG